MTTQVPPDLLQTPYRKNTIINGNFDIWQRGTSFPAAASGSYTADRYTYATSGVAVHTVSRSTDVPTYAESGIKSNYSILLDVTTADTSITGSDYSSLIYYIEGYDYAQIAGSNATLSFWIKGTKTGIHSIAIRNAGSDRSYVKEYTIDVTDTWEKKVITIPLTETAGTWDYTTGRGLGIFFTQACGPTLQTTANAWQTGNFVASSNQVNATDSTANNFRIAQVQFELGDVATDFERRSFGEELALCQRYYQKSYPQGTDPGTANIAGITSSRVSAGGASLMAGSNTKLVPTMRAIPSITWYSYSTGASGKIRDIAGSADISLSSTGATGDATTGYFVATAGQTDGNVMGSHYTADAEL